MQVKILITADEMENVKQGHFLYKISNYLCILNGNKHNSGDTIHPHRMSTEALQTLRTILTIYDKTWEEWCALFIDLVKAFNSVNHNLLYQVLAKYGLPENLINTMR